MIDGDRVVANFFVHYEIDGETPKHRLMLEQYGGDDVHCWVLLEPVVAPAPAVTTASHSSRRGGDGLIGPDKLFALYKQLLQFSCAAVSYRAQGGLCWTSQIIENPLKSTHWAGPTGWLPHFRTTAH